MTQRASVICVCYNHERFVADAIASVLRQTHANTELIIVDDGSSDNSVSTIEVAIRDFPQVQFFPLPRNGGYCRAFNHGLAYATGDFMIDLAADDILLPERIATGISELEERGPRYGVHFSDAWMTDEEGRELFRHSERFPHEAVPQGDVYRNLIERYFICSPTMMFRRSVIESLNGYDESLLYEDFDFWIRSSRTFYYCYSPEVLVRKRIVGNALSKKQFSVLNPQLWSTFHVCQKIMALNRNTAEQAALARRIRYEMRVCARLLNFALVFKYARLYLANNAYNFPEV